MDDMMNPKRFALAADGAQEHMDGDFVKFSTYVELVAHAIEGAANKEFLDRQVPELKKALVRILMLASSGDVAGDDDVFADIAHIASEALSQ
jgi:hypothetical protein